MYNLKNSIPFLAIVILFTLSCVLQNIAIELGSESGQYLAWSITVVPVVAGLVYSRIRNK